MVISRWSKLDRILNLATANRDLSTLFTDGWVSKNDFSAFYQSALVSIAYGTLRDRSFLLN
jgi:hypothetical protein